MRRFRRLQAALLAALAAAVVTGCGREAVNAGDGAEPASASPSETSETAPTEEEEETMQMEEQTVRRPGSSEDTLPTPEDFPEGYDYGTGRIGDWDFSANYRRLPEPEGNETVLTAEPDTSRIQALYLWEEGNVPAQTVEPENMAGYFDPPGFRPYLTAIPVPEGTEVKGAVVLLAGGAFAFRGNFTDALPTAAHLRQLGFQTFIVDYRLRPYTQEEGALDVARAVRFIRKTPTLTASTPTISR